MPDLLMHHEACLNGSGFHGIHPCMVCSAAERGGQWLPEGAAGQTEQRDGRPEQDLCGQVG